MTLGSCCVEIFQHEETEHERLVRRLQYDTHILFHFLLWTLETFLSVFLTPSKLQKILKSQDDHAKTVPSVKVRRTNMTQTLSQLLMESVSLLAVGCAMKQLLKQTPRIKASQHIITFFLKEVCFMTYIRELNSCW